MKRDFLLGCTGLAVLLGAGVLISSWAPQEASVKPGINESFLRDDVDVERWVERFEREGREVYDHRHEIMEAAGVKEGMVVADIGAGTGLFTEMLARATGESGAVYAVDIVPEFLEKIRERTRGKAGMGEVKTVLCTERSVELPASSIDFAFICDVYHHFEYPESSLASLYRAMKPGAEVMVVEFERIPGKSSEWIMGHIRAGKEVFRQEIESAGFEFVEEVDLLETSYIHRFRKPGGERRGL